ncbi:YgeY family selenium metabolism-linked hydrolase [Clostridium gasigenes]|uniref:YgeY family selenium metabolism-linked hydrolase n=1 Tax=Clostridium gasigenes TaxID=94869 RepID=A0A7X0SDU7_9CLOT|nr:YgeY family selenium metabolism-linked hydrolase [Clostridium gasigenes]MBB6623616.1 YgeY family selenium metabolism-linked hydrolase [Clostridium gasigenes]MBB6715690.1 YgeY family selenium metabolism-linked hydrolase [Clostridium gasigenes]MBU3087583.1 YgeY family selenium metabolism-linked hydrolase [Clostridium gasigenes]MBU3105386.1 YgeY family selenium metabolism-linked hydrolase [Clostridium gasigenes]MBU3131786.1 YgeY family selenium metabolism-linked hydrolase [Clostridium gasigene
MNVEDIKLKAKGYETQMTKFLRDLIAIPGESANEELVVKRISQEMKMLGFDKVEIDPMGNVLGYMGNGKTLIAYDAHIDTVGIGELSNWTFDPYKGYENEEEIGGRGSSDQLGGIVSATYGAKIMKDLDLLSDKYTVLVTGTVQEEDCDGVCWQYIHNESKIKPEFVVITEPTNGNIYRGHRGRMEIRVEVKGVSCHGSAPERGDNAIYKMSDILQEVRTLNDKLHYDAFLGKGTVTVSEIFYNSPSRCAVADMCAISLDRRLTDGETFESALEEVRNLPFAKKYNAKVTMYEYERPSWTGLVYPTECYFPTWVLPEDAPATKAMVESYEGMYGTPLVDKWTFSTNGVSIMGRYGIPCIGFGPGKEEEAHAPNEKTWKADLVKCAAVYAALPTIYCANK